MRPASWRVKKLKSKPQGATGAKKGPGRTTCAPPIFYTCLQGRSGADFGIPYADLQGMATVRRYDDDSGWYLVVDGFVRYRLDYVAQRIVDDAGLQDFARMPRNLYQKLRLEGHLMRLWEQEQPCLSKS